MPHTVLLRPVATGLLSLALAGPAAAQALPSYYLPWTPATTVPAVAAGYAYPTTALLQLPGGTGIWAARTSSGYHGAYTTDVLASADNGQTWRIFSTDFYTGSAAPQSGASVADLWALDGQRAWLVLNRYPGGSRQLYQTTTGPQGLAVAATQVPGAVQEVCFFDASTGLALTTAAGGASAWQLYRTANGGQSWQLVTALPPAAAGTLAGKTASLGSDFWLTTQQGLVLHTPDRGLSWTAGAAPQGLAAPAFRDAQHGLATAAAPDPDRPLYRTADGGATWSLVAATGPRRRYALAAVPGSAGTYVSVGKAPSDSSPGDQPGTAISYDEGQTWRNLGGDSGSWMDDVAADATGRIWAAFYGSGTLGYLPLNTLATAGPPPPAPGAYPTPTTGRVQLPAAGAYRQAAVYDAAGRQCRTAALGPAETSLELGSLGAGVFVLRLSGGPAAPRQQRVVVAP